MTVNGSSLPTSDLQEAHRRLREFRRGDHDDRLFVQPTCHPADPTGFCYCDGHWWKAIPVYLKALWLGLAFRLPYNWFKVWTLRRLGARVGKGVYFAPGVRIDPVFPELITIEDRVFFGTGAKIFTHEFRIDEFRAGRVIVRQGAFIGGFAIIGCGVEIGQRGVVSACAVVDRDVPAGATLIASPARILRRPDAL